jgi:hypothetical protein
MDKINEITKGKVFTINDKTVADDTEAKMILYRFLELKTPGREKELDVFLRNLSEKSINELREIIFQSYLSYVEEYQNLQYEDCDKELKCLCNCPLLKNLILVNRYVYIRHGQTQE